MKSICEVNCSECFLKSNCNGCLNTNGCPFSENCFIARYILQNGKEAYDKFVGLLINEINFLAVTDMPDVTSLNPLKGSFVNLEYTLDSGQKAKLLNDNMIYLGTQLHKEGTDRCFGIAADESHILVCEYGKNGVDPELLIYTKR